MDALLLRLVSPPTLALARQFLRFGTVGAVGFVVDAGIIYATRHQLGLYGAGLASYLAAATVTWALNRAWTFRGRGTGRAHRQWALFLLANLAGFALNRGTYALLLTYVPICAEQPVLAVLAGVAVAMFLNFHLSRKLVFR
jgi:putative flippase GtrA